MTRVSRFVALATMAAAALLSVGCNTYHYYDVTIKLDTSSLPLEKAGYLQFCQVRVSGADNELLKLPKTTAEGMVACPIGQNYPVLGTFEYATFADSGKLTFTFAGFDTTGSTATSFQCASGSVDFTASSTITQAMDMTVTGGPNECVSQTQQ
ncbi:MAG: hypothetical protein ACJ8F1_24910 [Polyangia bacterium]|jgi:hypothetical protein